MQSDNLAQLLHKGFHITLGATSFLIETLQDGQKREDNLGKLRSDIDLLTEEWVQKGASIELEARNFVDTILERQSQPSPDPNPETEAASGKSHSPTPATPVPFDIQQQEIQELTAQIAALRTELEKLQVQDSQN